MKKTEEVVWEDPLQVVAAARYHNTSKNELILSMLSCCCICIWQGEWMRVILSSWKKLR